MTGWGGACRSLSLLKTLSVDLQDLRLFLKLLHHLGLLQHLLRLVVLMYLLIMCGGILRLLLEGLVPILVLLLLVHLLMVHTSLHL